MLWAYVAGAFIYALIGVIIGQFSWHVWKRDVSFNRTYQIGHSLYIYYEYRCRWSWGLSVLFPVSCDAGITRWDDPHHITIYMDDQRQGLDEKKRLAYLAVMCVTWPIKVAFNASVWLFWLCRALVSLIIGVLGILPDMLSGMSKQEMVLFKYLATAKKKHESRTVNESPKLRVASKTYKQRLQELQDERAKMASRTTELDQEIAAVTLEMETLQGGAFRTSDSIVMHEPAESKRRAG